MTVALLADEQVAVLVPEIEALTTWLAYKAFADKYFGPAAARLKVEIENQADPNGSGEVFGRVAQVEAFGGDGARLAPDMRLPTFAGQEGVWEGAEPDAFNEFLYDAVTYSAPEGGSLKAGASSEVTRLSQGFQSAGGAHRATLGANHIGTLGCCSSPDRCGQRLNRSTE